MWSGRSHPELPEVVIEVLVLHDTPAPSGNPAKDTTRWPLSGRSAITKAPNQVAQPGHVRLPRGWARGQELRRAPSLALGPRQHVNHQPVEGRVRQGAGGWCGLQLPKTLAKGGAHVADHVWGGEAPPERLALRR